MRSRKPFNTSSTIILFAAVALIGLTIWAGLAEIEQLSRAGGQVIPAGRVQIIQSTDGGVITEILVREGDKVRKGQKLITLDRVKLTAAVDESRAKVAALKTIRSRLEAELFEKPLTFSADVRSYGDFMANQQQLYAKRRKAYLEEIAAQEKMADLIKQELSMNRPLLAQGDVSRSDILRLERAVADAENQIVARRNKYLQDLQTEYAKVEEDLVSAEQTLTQRTSAQRDTELFAPTAGIIKNVRLTTVGGVLRPGDEALQIVPTDEELIVEAKVSPADIAHVRLGQRASVKFDTYDSGIYGSADGEVIYISPDTLNEQRQNGEQVYYRVHIKTDISTMRPRNGEMIAIQPGMTATTEIITGHNTVLRYLTKPILKTISMSMGER